MAKSEPSALPSGEASWSFGHFWRFLLASRSRGVSIVGSFAELHSTDGSHSKAKLCEANALVTLVFDRCPGLAPRSISCQVSHRCSRSASELRTVRKQVLLRLQLRHRRSVVMPFGCWASTSHRFPSVYLQNWVEPMFRVESLAPPRDFADAVWSASTAESRERLPLLQVQYGKTRRTQKCQEAHGQEHPNVQLAPSNR